MGDDDLCHPKPLNCFNEYEYTWVVNKFECDECAENYFFDEDSECVTCSDVIDDCLECPSLN